jgi:hypothetical protein
MTLPTARDFHNCAFKAQVASQNNTIAFADDGSNYGEGCQVRFTGLYHRKNQADR